MAEFVEKFRKFARKLCVMAKIARLHKSAKKCAPQDHNFLGRLVLGTEQSRQE